MIAARSQRALTGTLAATLFTVGMVLTPTSAVVASISVTPPGGGGQFTSIQAAINSASDGDIIAVAGGTYTEFVTISKYVTVQGAGAGTTVIAAPGGGRAVVNIEGVPFRDGVRAELGGFTIRGGNGPSGHAGGILVWLDADPVIADNVIEQNHAQGYGGGISVIRDSDPIIRNNMIRNNTAHAGGGGVFVALQSNPTIYGNTLTGNVASGVVIPSGGASGGAIYLEATPGQPSELIHPIVMNNTIEDNHAEFAGGGVMLRTGATAVIENNTINDNTAAFGAGVHIETTGSTVVLRANTISNNIAAADGRYAGSGFGGGVAVYDRSNVTLAENVFTGNRASRGGGAVSVAEFATTTLESNTMIGNGVGPTPDGSHSEGGGIYVANASLTAINNVFARNDAQIGGALAVLDNGAASIVSNSINGNISSLSPGGAIFIRQFAARGDVSNNIFSENSNYALFEQNQLRVVKRNNLFASSTGAYFGPSGDRTPDALNAGGALWAADNFTGDPGYANASIDDYSLLPTSAAIDRATLSDVPVVPVSDLRNALRSPTVDVGAFEFQAIPVITGHVYRFWSRSKSSHFYTIDVGERNLVASSFSPVEWRYEGVAYDAFSSAGEADTIPLYRFYSQTFGGHFYTASLAERDAVDADYPDEIWLYEGIAYYVYPEEHASAFPVFRFWSPANRHHFYTASAAERDYVIASFSSNTWTYEGPRFKVPR